MLLVEQVGDALEHNRGLARSRDTRDEQHRHIGMTHNLVLLALDGRRDGLELLGMVRTQGVQEERVLNGHGGVEVSPKLIAVDIELAPQLKLDGTQGTVHRVAGLAVLLVVVGLRDGVPPIHDERNMVLIGDPGGTDVHVAGGAVGAHLEADLGEIGLAQKQQDLAQAVGVEVVVLVVGVDDRVQRLDGRKGLHRLIRAPEIGANLLAHRHEVGRSLFVVARELLSQLVAVGDELTVYGAQVLLLLAHDGIVFEKIPCGVVRCFHDPPQVHAHQCTQRARIASCSGRRPSIARGKPPGTISKSLRPPWRCSQPSLNVAEAGYGVREHFQNTTWFGAGFSRRPK